MQFLILAHDYKGSLERRMQSREAHIALSDEAAQRGEQLYGAALLDEAGQMCGSVMIVDFPTREAVDAWLSVEPYVTNRVWENVQIIPCRTGPSFDKKD